MSRAEPDRPRTYRFGPLERRGVVGGLRPGQVSSLAAACVVAVIVFRLQLGALGLFAALALVAIGTVFAFMPFAGRTAEAWTPVVVDWLLQGIRNGHRFRSAAPSAGLVGPTGDPDAHRPIELPPCLDACRLLALPVDDRDLGILEDRRMRALTAVIAVRIRAVGLLGTREHEARLARWGQVLAGLARSGSPIRRLQVLQRALPGDGDVLWRHFLTARDPGIPADSRHDRSYRSLLELSTRVTQDREVLLAVQVDQRRAWARASRDAAARHLGKTEQAQMILLREIRTLVSRFDPADVEVAGLLSVEQYAAALRNAYDPYRRPAATDGAPAVPREPRAAPTATDAGWTLLRADGAFHRSYWIAQWPRLPVGPLFLTPLLLGAHAVHSVSVLIEPVSPDRSRRAVEAAITSDEADEELRQRRGFRTTARRRRQQAAALEREEELASGHEEVRFAGYITVTGRSESELDDACGQVEQAAQQAYLDLQPLWGEQDVGFVNGALPVARGLRSSRVGWIG